MEKVGISLNRQEAEALYDIINLNSTQIKEKEIDDAIPESSSRNSERKTPTISTNSIPDSPQKSKPSEENSSQEVGEAQFSLAKSEDGKAHPYTKRGADAAAAAALTELRFVK